MISPAQFVNGIWMGTVLIGLGLLPGLLENVTDFLRKITGMSLPVPISSRPQTQIQQVSLKRQPWLVALGAVIMAATLLLYFAI